MIDLRRLMAIIVKELRQLKRDRVSFAMIVGIPILELLLFGYAINLDVRHLKAAVLDQAHTEHSRELIAQLGANQVLDLRRRLSSRQQISELMRRGEISAAIVVPADFDTRLARGGEPAFQVVVDGSDQAVQQAVRQLAEYPLRALDDPLAQLQSSVEIVNFYNPQRLAPLNSVPGLIGVILTMTMVLFTAIALVRERERGNLEMLIATPVSPWELTIGKVLPFIGIGLIQVTLTLLAGYVIFGVPVRGNLAEFYFAALAFIFASLSLGVLLSTIAKSQFQAMQLTMFTFLPQILLSGFAFPFPGMPPLAQWIGELMPLTHFVRLARGIALRSASLLDLWPEVAALLAFAAIVLGVAVTRVSKRLD